MTVAELGKRMSSKEFYQQMAYDRYIDRQEEKARQKAKNAAKNTRR